MPHGVYVCVLIDFCDPAGKADSRQQLPVPPGEQEGGPPGAARGAVRRVQGEVPPRRRAGAHGGEHARFFFSAARSSLDYWIELGFLDILMIIVFFFFFIPVFELVSHTAGVPVCAFGNHRVLQHPPALRSPTLRLLQ